MSYSRIPMDRHEPKAQSGDEMTHWIHPSNIKLAVANASVPESRRKRRFPAAAYTYRTINGKFYPHININILYREKNTLDIMIPGS